jgi:hypothetical protein
VDNLGEGGKVLYTAVKFTLPTNIEKLFVYRTTINAGSNAANNVIVNSFISTDATLASGAAMMCSFPERPTGPQHRPLKTSNQQRATPPPAIGQGLTLFPAE